MKAGKELVALVAQNVMGWHRQPYSPKIPGVHLRPEWFDAQEEATLRFAEEGCGDYYHPDEAWEPSTRIAHVEEVALELRKRGYIVQAEWHPRGTGFARVALKGEAIVDRPTQNWDAEGESVAHAICLAALAALARATLRR